MDIQLTLTTEPSVMMEVIDLANGTGAEVSTPEALSMDGALNAGISIEDVKTTLEIATILFTTGKAAFTFLSAMREYLRNRAPSAIANLADARTGRPAGRLHTNSSDEEVQDLINRLTG